MSEISLPYHTIIPAILSLLILGFIFFKRNKLFRKGKWKWFWISFSLFFVLYLLIVGGVSYVDISLKLNLQKFDLNGDGFFNGSEISPEQNAAMKKVSADTGRNFSFITGLIFSGIIAILVFVIGKSSEYIIKYIKRKKDINTFV